MPLTKETSCTILNFTILITFYAKMESLLGNTSQSRIQLSQVAKISTQTLGKKAPCDDIHEGLRLVGGAEQKQRPAQGRRGGEHG